MLAAVEVAFTTAPEILRVLEALVAAVLVETIQPAQVMQELPTLAVAVAVGLGLVAQVMLAELADLESSSSVTPTPTTMPHLLQALQHLPTLAAIKFTLGRAPAQSRFKLWLHNSHPHQTLTVCGP